MPGSRIRRGAGKKRSQARRRQVAEQHGGRREGGKEGRGSTVGGRSGAAAPGAAEDVGSSCDPGLPRLWRIHKANLDSSSCRGMTFIFWCRIFLSLGLLFAPHNHFCPSLLVLPTSSLLLLPYFLSIFFFSSLLLRNTPSYLSSSSLFFLSIPLFPPFFLPLSPFSPLSSPDHRAH